MNKRYLSRTLIVVGSILIIAGLVFTAQSKSIVGPQSSFMYSNPEWTVNGFLISGVGLAILASGITLWIFNKFNVLLYCRHFRCFFCSLSCQKLIILKVFENIDG
jgi:uncharacterized membrane protein